MGVDAFGLAMGLGFVLSFGYWCTDFLVVQRAMAADSMAAARRTPLIAAFPKMLFPFLVVMPGLIALSAHPFEGQVGRVGQVGQVREMSLVGSGGVRSRYNEPSIPTRTNGSFCWDVPRPVRNPLGARRWRHG